MANLKPYYDHAGIIIYAGHILTVLESMEAESVQMCVTSPPYWGLRDYGLEPQIWDADEDCQHWWEDENIRKDRGIACGATAKCGNTKREILGTQTNQGQFCQLCGAWRGSLGLEPTPELYVEHLVQVFRGVRRVLRKDGTLWLNLGDSYAQSGGGMATSEHKEAKERRKKKGYQGHGGWEETASRAGNTAVSGLKPKDLCMIPARVALALQADGWWLRSDIIWSKPNPMPESVTDRPTKSHEYMFLLTKSAKYFYDNDAIREPSEDRAGLERFTKGGVSADDFEDNKWIRREGSLTRPPVTMKNREYHPMGRNKRSVWTVTTQPYKEAHFATFPTKLIEPCIKAGTSEKGCCSECGSPWERVVDIPQDGRPMRSDTSKYNQIKDGLSAGQQYQNWRNQNPSKTIGWQPTCKCNADKQPCVILDPFGGSMTTAHVAKELGRKAVMIDLNKEYIEMGISRLKQDVLPFN